MLAGGDSHTLLKWGKCFLHMIISDIFFVLPCEPKGLIGKAPIVCYVLQGKLRASS